MSYVKKKKLTKKSTISSPWPLLPFCFSFFAKKKKSKLQNQGKKITKFCKKRSFFHLIRSNLGKDFFVSFITLYMTSIKNLFVKSAKQTSFFFINNFFVAKDLTNNENFWKPPPFILNSLNIFCERSQHARFSSFRCYYLRWIHWGLVRIQLFHERWSAA